MEISINELPVDKRKPKPRDENDLGFGNIFTDHMFLLDYKEGRGWHNARIEPFHDLELSPAAMSLHYGQMIFEGLKCYRRPDGGLQLFRAKDNFKRFNRSAARLCIPELDIELAVTSLKELLRLESEWVPRAPGTTLYIRQLLSPQNRIWEYARLRNTCTL